MKRQLWLLVLACYSPILILTAFLVFLSVLQSVFLSPSPFIPWILLALWLFYLPLSQSLLVPKQQTFLKGALIFILITLTLYFFPYHLAVWMPLIFGILFYLSMRDNHYSAALHWVMVAILGMLVIGLTNREYHDSMTLLSLMLSTTIGLLIAFSLVYLKQFVYLQHLQWRLYFYVGALEKLTRALFDCYLKPDYPECRYLYEKRIHDAKVAAFFASSKLEKFFNSLTVEKSDLFTRLLNCKNQCDDALILLQNSGQLRHRVTDHATFRFCATEIFQLLDYLLSAFKHLKQTILKHESSSKHPSDSPLTTLEGIYELVLQVVANEPVSFLLFIDNIRKLSQCLLNSRVQ